MVEYRNHTADEKATKPLDLVHSDLAGPMNPCSLEGSKYTIIFADFSGAMFVYFLRNKSETAKATARFLADISLYATIKRLRTDNGMEYTHAGQEFQNLVQSCPNSKNKICREKSAPYSAQWKRVGTIIF